MTEPTTEAAETTGFGPFTGRFGVAAAVVGLLLLVIGILGFVDGYMELGLFVPEDEPVLKGLIVLTFGAGLGVVALFIAAYMEPGFGDDHGH